MNIPFSFNDFMFPYIVKMATSPLPVLLGVADTECQENGNWNLNKIGGLPVSSTKLLDRKLGISQV